MVEAARCRFMHGGRVSAGAENRMLAENAQR
jgi:hypothetical protein